MEQLTEKQKAVAKQFSVFRENWGYTFPYGCFDPKYNGEFSKNCKEMRETAEKQAPGICKVCNFIQKAEYKEKRTMADEEITEVIKTLIK